MGARNDGAHTGTTLTNSRRKQLTQRADVDALSERLSERDWAILRSVAEHQFLTVRHIEAIHFADHPPATGGRLARRALARLRRLRLLGAINRRVGGVRGGSSGMTHYVDVVGRQLIDGRSGRHLRGFREPSQRFVNHRLAVAETHVQLIAADRQKDFELVMCAVEPQSWRRYVGLGGARLTLKADLYAETATTADSDFVNPWFIEVDLGTEHIPTLLKKCRDYEAYRRSGTEQADGDGFPLVIWSMTHPDPFRAEQRRTAFRDAIDRDPQVPNALFRIVAPNQLTALLQKGGDL
ncbi:replication-relaxation family protein [Mycobacterium sp.]|uniref:replication-relaxation family protein n=1 Tax=Mycobacterium sp. TaxID=1785 RepID=UPI002BDFAE99|nr:replication-relaxation family protein [Mycobacterium sp.]HKP39463.1 replication-relaxation family protein [Mycobacterium sp.]